MHAVLQKCQYSIHGDISHRIGASHGNSIWNIRQRLQWTEKNLQFKNMDCVRVFFANKYHELKLTRSWEQERKYIIVQLLWSQPINNLTLATNTDQSHVNQLTATITHMIKINKILGHQIKQLAKTNTILERQGLYDRTFPKRMRVTL